MDPGTRQPRLEHQLSKLSPLLGMGEKVIERKIREWASGNSPFGVEKELCLELAPGHQLLWSDEEGHQKVSPLWLRKEKN